jgi:Zn-dependent M28 family amino/carboxypeptidase
MAGTRPARTVRFLLFGTEEPPYFNTDDMGSRVYARRAAEAGDRIVAMYSLEMLGYYSDEPGSQRHPPPLQLFFPHRGDFIAFVGNPASGSLLRSSLRRFRETTAFPSEGIVSSSMIPGVELSDHASFWRNGFPAVLVSDTGPFRNDNYHLSSDTAATLDFERMARVIVGVRSVIEDAAGS